MGGFRGGMRTPDPIWAILLYRGQGLRWLARKMGYSNVYITKVAAGKLPVTSEFMARASDALDLPLLALFLDSRVPVSSVQSTDEAIHDFASPSASRP